MRLAPRFLARRPFVASVLAVTLVVVVGAGYLLTHSDSKATASAPYRLVAVSTGTVRQSIASTGTVEPATQDALTFGVSGQVSSVGVVAGQRVSAGQVLATINSASLQAALAQAEAALATDQAKVVTDTSAAVSSTQLAADTAAVSAVQGEVKSARSNLTQAKLISPTGGIVASVGLTVGQQVAGISSSGSGGASSGTGSGSGGTGSGGTGGGAGGSAGGGSNAGAAGSGSSGIATSSTSPDILVISTDSWIANATVDDTEVGLVAVGDQAQLVVEGATGTIYGTVASVGMIPTSTSGVASYPVLITVTGNPAGLHAGAAATVSLIYKQLTNVLVVPTAAVHVVAGKQVVYQMSGSKQVAHQVSIGVASGGSSQVLSGLTEGDQVVVTTTRGTGTSNSRTGGTTRTGGGGFGGGGFGGGGFGGGGAGPVRGTTGGG